LCDTDILLVLFKEGFQVEFAVALVASDSKVVIDLLRFVLVTSGVVEASIELVSGRKQLVAA
jgi:hypothetical protein